MKKISLTFVFLLLVISSKSFGQPYNLDEQLSGFDDYIEEVMGEWNTPGIAVGIVIKDELVYSKGYGYRELENELPVTSKTLFPIASNTKLFTTVAMGMLVEEGKLAWDEPIRRYVPQINFYNQELNNSVTLRDMLAHRTGISRHDFIWYKSDFSRKELIDRLKYLEPAQPIRERILYNNLMYAAAGYSLELITGNTWEAYVKENIFDPLGMNSTLFTIEEMEVQNDFAYPYYEDRETDLLTKRPFYREQQGVGPAGSIISNVEDMSKWVIALMNQGSYEGENVITADLLKETLQPAIAYPNTTLETQGHDEILNTVYGMGRIFSAYKGHYLTMHGGAIGGFYSQVSMMPYDSLGVIVFVNGAHNGPLSNVITYNIYDRLLGLEQTDFNERRLEEWIEFKKALKEARESAGSDRVVDTKTSHPTNDFVGEYEDPAYGILEINSEGDKLIFDFNNIELPLNHYHYNRFDTPDDQVYGKFSVNFLTNPQGEISAAVMSLDQSEVTFTKKPDASLFAAEKLQMFEGYYELAGQTVEVLMTEEGVLTLIIPGQPVYTLVPYKPNMFTMKEFSDYRIEFILDGEAIEALEVAFPTGKFKYLKQ